MIAATQEQIDSAIARFDHLGTLEKGWLWDEGEPIPAAPLFTLRDRLVEQMKAGAITRPHIFPTEKGGIELEWDFGEHHISIEYDFQAGAVWMMAWDFTREDATIADVTIPLNDSAYEEVRQFVLKHEEAAMKR